MGFPDIEATEVGNTGLLWLFLSYGGVLFYASNMISDGSELLLLVPSLAGLVGSCVLPVLGAVPDGAIMAFSGMGDLATAQDTLSVGVGALAGSTIMLLTVPWGLSILAGKVDIVDGEANYASKTGKGTEGIAVTETVRTGGKIMVFTSLAYLMIQIPASYLKSEGTDDIGAAEKYYALAALIFCFACFVGYLVYQIKQANSGCDDAAKLRREAVIKDSIKDKKISIKGAMAGWLLETKGGLDGAANYSAINNADDSDLDSLSVILKPFFHKFDYSKDGRLDVNEISAVLNDLGETHTTESARKIFQKFDLDNSGFIEFNEFVKGMNAYIVDDSSSMWKGGDGEGEDEEDEEIPEEIAALPVEQQQSAIKKKAFLMLLFGTCLVLTFSDPMVDVINEIGARTGISPFYVSFILAPLASNASEFIASYYYALKKTKKTITISLSALEGAACMNNTFCLLIFMALIYFRGLAWQYTAETIVIVVVQLLLAVFARKTVNTTTDAYIILAIFPLSIVLVSVLENVVGLD